GLNGYSRLSKRPYKGTANKGLSPQPRPRETKKHHQGVAESQCAPPTLRLCIIFPLSRRRLGSRKIPPPWQLSPATASRLREVPCALEHKPLFPSLTPAPRLPCAPGRRWPALVVLKPQRAVLRLDV